MSSNDHLHHLHTTSTPPPWRRSNTTTSTTSTTSIHGGGGVEVVSDGQTEALPPRPTASTQAAQPHVPSAASSMSLPLSGMAVHIIGMAALLALPPTIALTTWALIHAGTRQPTPTPTNDGGGTLNPDTNRQEGK